MVASIKVTGSTTTIGTANTTLSNAKAMRLRNTDSVDCVVTVSDTVANVVLGTVQLAPSWRRRQLKSYRATMAQANFWQTPVRGQARKPVEDQEPREPLPMMNCHQLSLALRIGGFGWDELS
jgi:hypothetical protein